MQGYLFSRPMAATECAALLRTGRRLSLDAR
jgi:EAL domain-containing protein (putative c-di-GMP-specific phosphodiesterase class I)